MLDTTPDKLWEEVQAAEAYRRERLAHRRQLVQELHGPMYGNAADGGDASENHVFEYVTNIVPRLIFNNPRATVNTRRQTRPHRMIAEAMHLGLERWIADSGLRDTLRELATDMMVGPGWAMLDMEDRPDMTAPEEIDIESLGWPVLTRLSPDHVFADPEAMTPRDFRYVGYKYRMDLEDLLEEARENEDGTWNADVARELQPSLDARHSSDVRPFPDSPEREEVWLYEVWIPEDPVEEDDGLHFGRIHTLATTGGSSKAKSVRRPRDWYGPETGPFVMFGAYYVPDHAYPLAPLVATAPQMQDLNQLARAVTQGAKNFKSLIVARSPELADMIQRGDHLHVFATGEEMSDDAVRMLNVGGVQAEQLAAQADAREKIQRISGLSDAMRGEPAGDTTATAEQIAFQGASIRVDFLRQTFEGSTSAILLKVAWFLFNDDTIAFSLKVDGSNGDEGELWFEGGPAADVEMAFGDLELQIEPYSMERTNDSIRMKRRMDSVMLTMQMAQLMPQAPHVRWKELARDVGDAWNIPDYDSRFNWDVLEQLWVMQGAQAQADTALPAAAASSQIGRDGPADTIIRPAGYQSGIDARRETE